MATSPPPIFPAKTPSPAHTHSSAHSPPDDDEDTEGGESWDGSSASSSFLGTDGALRSVIQRKNRPVCPSALSTALLSLTTQAEDDVGSGFAVGEGEKDDDDEAAAPALAGSGAGSGAGSEGPASVSDAPLLDQPPPAKQLPPLGPSAVPTAVDGAETANTAAVESRVEAVVGAASGPHGFRPAQSHGTGPLSVPYSSAVIGAAAAHEDAAVVGSKVGGEFRAAPVDMALFHRNRTELNLIRAQLKALKGKDLANYQSGRNVEGRNFKAGYNNSVPTPARHVFGKMPKPSPVGPMANSGPNGPSHAKRQPPPTLSKPWVAAVCSNLDEKRFSLNFRPPQVVNGETIVEASDEALDMARSRWSDYLVGHFLEGRLPFPLVEEVANRMWAKFGLIETLSFNKEFFLFKFPEASSREKLLDHGPFLFSGRPLILQQWTPSLVLSKACLSKIPLWAKIYNIPLSMWNPIGLGDIASAIGVPLFADTTTEKLQRFDFARICIEVDASKPLLDEFNLRVQGKVVKLQVEYQWRPKRCSKCCTFGHLCPSAISPSGPSATGPSAGSPSNGLRAAVWPPAASILGPVPGLIPALNHAPASVHGSVPASAPPMIHVPGSGPALNPVPAPASAVNHAPVPVPVFVPAPSMFPVLDSGPVPVQALRPGPDLVPGPVSAPKSPLGSVPLSVGAAHPVSVAHAGYVDGIDGDEGDSEEGYEEGLESTLFYSAHSPKTRGQKARQELSLTFNPPQPRGSRKKGKRKGKRAKS